MKTRGTNQYWRSALLASLVVLIAYAAYELPLTYLHGADGTIALGYMVVRALGATILFPGAIMMTLVLALASSVWTGARNHAFVELGWSPSIFLTWTIYFALINLILRAQHSSRKVHMRRKTDP